MDKKTEHFRNWNDRVKISDFEKWARRHLIYKEELCW